MINEILDKKLQLNSKKFLNIIIFAFIILFSYTSHSAQAKINSNNISTSLNEISTNGKILESLELMKNSIAKEAYNNILGGNRTGKIIKIEFANLAKFGHCYKDCDALGWIRNKQLYIYINKKYKNAPPEALCALIASRTFHQDPINSINEQVYIYTVEAVTWDFFVKNNPNLTTSHDLLAIRENNMNTHYNKSPKDAKYVEKIVTSDKRFQFLLRQSPDFNDEEFKLKMSKLLKDNYIEPTKILPNENNSKNKPEFPNERTYLQNLEKNIKVNWTPPKNHHSRRTTVLFVIDKNGNLMQCELLKSSGNDKLDESTINAIKKTAPFEPLPRQYNEESVNIRFTFDYNVKHIH